MVIRTTHCFCSQHHYVAAIAWEDEGQSPESAIEELKGLVADGIEDGIVDKVCFVCGDTGFVFENNPETFDSLQSAMEYIFETQLANIKAKQALEALRN